MKIGMSFLEISFPRQALILFIMIVGFSLRIMDNSADTLKCGKHPQTDRCYIVYH